MPAPAASPLLLLPVLLLTIAGAVPAQATPDGNEDGVLLIVTFSGGGLRATAFGYGVVEAMAETPVSTGTLLDRIDRVSGVSGGSLLAAQVALDHRGEALAAFRQTVLLANIELDLVLAVGRHSFRLLGPAANRSDVAAGYYDRLLGGATLATPTGCELWIQATDLQRGEPLAFDPATLTHLGLAPEEVPVGVAIAASAALPGVLPPLVLHLPGHRPADCPGASGCPPSPEEDQDLVDLPLADGGIVDNLGLEVLLRGGVPPGTRAVVVIVVNARRLHVPPGIVASSALLTAGYSAVIQQRRIDDLLLALARERLRLLEAQGRILGRHLRTELQVISFDQSTRSEELDVIGTRLHLQEEEVDRLVQEGHAVMRSRLPELLPFWEEAGRTPPPR